MEWGQALWSSFNDGLLRTYGCLAVGVIWDPHSGHCLLGCVAVRSARHTPMFRKEPAAPIFKDITERQRLPLKNYYVSNSRLQDSS